MKNAMVIGVFDELFPQRGVRSTSGAQFIYRNLFAPPFRYS